ncbi:hypothetical protein BDW74DRAFT_168566 [Aspergillus multicolor]|uniref:uncharacterized protein n=1 Tax=Aspergillus multicolor TaxID=41759 RepID=UPI003CCD4382
MGSMTRNRCVNDAKPTSPSVRHYAERAADGVGLIVAEGTFIAPHGAEWPNAPVMFDQEHVRTWKKVTDEVHRVGGKMLFQPWHPGRIQNDDMPMLKKYNYPVQAPSKGHTENITEIEDPKKIVEQFRHSVILAKEAGFDGIELLSQGGYLLHNFLCSHTNLRTDTYGGSIPNRCRFPLEVLDAIISIWGSRLVGIKICPPDDYNDSAVSYAEFTEKYNYFITELMKRDLGFINLPRRGCNVGRNQDDYFKSPPRGQGKELPDGYDPVKQFGGMIKYPGSRTMLMVNHEYTPREAEGLVVSGKIDLACFARPFIYNPVSLRFLFGMIDFVSRLKAGKDFAVNDRGKTVNYGPFESPDENYNNWLRATAAATA